MTYKVGLTGGLASGKSTVAHWLAEAGFAVVDADRLVAELYRPGEPGALAVRRLFGDQVLTPVGAVDHVRLGALVFSDPDARRRLEGAIHPLVRQRFAEIARRAPGVAVLEATLLVEAGYGPDFDLVVTVEASEEVRRARAVTRGLGAEQAQARLTAQGDGVRRRAAARVVITNDGDLAALRAQTELLIERLRRATTVQ